MTSWLFLFLIYPINSIMVSVRGAPETSTSYPTGIINDLTWDECVEQCITTENCILAYSNSLDVCYLYAVGDVIEVRNDQNGYSDLKDTVSFKMLKWPEQCAKRSVNMLVGIINPYKKNNITSYTIAISPETGNYQIKYVYTLTDGCGDWLKPVPTCQNCPVTMFSFIAMPETRTVIAPPNIKSWTDCMFACYLNTNCMAAFMTGYPNCRNVMYGNVTSWIKLLAKLPKSKSLLNYIAVKYVYDKVSCLKNFASLFTSSTLYTQSTDQYSSYQTTTLSDNKTTIQYF
ncbi:PAN-3 domain-containing protein [Caenorhabditis elegans]|uniref:PAN-3 domain-containing protein n=1 Tax=Caenorhabditis elegans TaxID=6239 RepID=O44834_CAEEL|nr:PAN-3 domain-containing protein [Caenorhabditis elegans]CCD71778.2 PAN-3 domain-containing protein [Caenorhabditis elegans]|eukprot:NP_493962.2 Uncharacterized protein CELE_F54D12.2 [Caenorhabditis elegans]